MSSPHYVASRSISITYVPADCGSVIPGKSKAPKAFQDVGLARRLRNAGIPSVSEYHPLDAPATYARTTFAPGRIRNEDVNISVLQRVRSSLSERLAPPKAQPDFQLIIGGECCMLPGVLAAFWDQTEGQKDPTGYSLVYIDADLDLTSPTDAGSTGIFAGMNMAHLIRLPGTLDSVKQFSRPSGAPLCDVQNTYFFGTNVNCPSNKPDQLGYLIDEGYHIVTSAAVAREPEHSAKEVLGRVDTSGDWDAFLLHLDVDSIDPQMFPLANVPNFTGVGFEEMMRALKVFLWHPRCAGLAIAEVNPDHDPGLGMVERLTLEIGKALAVRDVPDQQEVSHQFV